MAEAMADGAARWVRWAGGACSDEPHSRCTVSDSQAKPGSSGWWQSALESLSAAEVEKLTGIAGVAGGGVKMGHCDRAPFGPAFSAMHCGSVGGRHVWGRSR